MTGWFDPGPYKRGLEHGRRTAEHAPMFDHEHRLRLELALMGKTNRDHRAFALGELRGYRQATGRPEPLYGHRLREPDGVRYLGGGNYGSTDR